ncbi:MAG: glucan biosynthesis protein D [Desulfobacteraceae bacterium]|nr:glucan biosynthesis protein D [Desulfobacteraceae bacterium]
MKKRFIGIVGLFVCLLFAVPSPPAARAVGDRAQLSSNVIEDFDYAWLKGYARQMAGREYRETEVKLPKAVRNLSWDDYQQIRFDPKHALWAKDESLFRAEFFHLGLYFQKPVTIYERTAGKARKIPYSSDMFRYPKSVLNGESLDPDLGFAGFRFKYHTDWDRDVAAFLGASYFRAVDRRMQYGLSARGLAIDTAVPGGEEFPRFTHFWLQSPGPGEGTVVVYALLDSPSAAGAYRFEITPGSTLHMKVDAAVYPRQEIQRLGIAPLTSMYMIGENSRRTDWDWRPEIHDSDGLAMQTGASEWIWRPLVNPRQLRFNAYADSNPMGFGLIQRDHNFDHYQDNGAFYNKRPGLWVEPVGNWGKGAVQLVEIPTEDETFDNIVAFWHPAEPVEAGQELLYSYHLYWANDAPGPAELARVTDTFTGLGGVVGQRRDYYSKRFVVDFKGGKLPMLGKAAEVRPVVTASAGRVELTSARPLKVTDGYRVRFDLVPPDSSQTPINLRLYLQMHGQPLTETWIYQWTPPPPEQRRLHNPEP